MFICVKKEKYSKIQNNNNLKLVIIMFRFNFPIVEVN